MRGFVIGLAVAALAGCSKPADNAAANGANTASTPAAATPMAAMPMAAMPAAPSAPAAATGPAGPITLAQLPAPTAGRWSRASIQNGKPQPAGSKCLNGKPIDPLDGMPMKCARMDVTRTASGGFVVIADCVNGVGMKAKLTLAGEGDFAKSFATDATMDMTGDPGGPVHIKNHSVWTYAAPICPK
jgi:hypothetical protein